MIPYAVYKTIDLGFTHIYIWGLMVAIAFLTGIFLAAKEAKKRKISPNKIFDISFYIVLGGIIGGRLGYILAHLSEFSNLINIFKVWNGGMSYYGGFIFATLFSYIYFKKHKLNFWKYADIFTIPLIIGHAIARIGCYITGEHIGSPTNLPWAIYIDGASRHPVPLYEFFSLILILFILLYIKKYKLKEGYLFLTGISLYAIIRFLLSFLRTDDPLYFGLTGSQYVSIIILIISIYLWRKNETNKSKSYISK